MQKNNLEYYVSIFQSNGRFDHIKDTKLQKILYLFSAYISYIYYQEIQDVEEISEEFKELKSHTIFVYLGSIIEAICYHFVKEQLDDEKSKRKYLELSQYKKLQKIKETDDLYICKLEEKSISFNNSINFNNLIHGLRDKKLVEENIIEKIDYFRKMRNLVHINALLEHNEIELIKELKKAFVDAKDIFDYFENF